MASSPGSGGASPRLINSDRLLREPSRATLSRSSALSTTRSSSYGTTEYAAPLSASASGPSLFSGLFAGSAHDADTTIDSRSYSERSGLLKGAYPEILRSEMRKADKARRRALISPRNARVLLYATLISAIVFTAIMLTIVYKVLAPIYVQTRIDATTLRFAAVNITSPSFGEGALGAGDFIISVSAVLSGLEPVDGTLNAFVATMSFGGQELATFTMPQTPARAGVDNVLSFSAPVTVTSKDVFLAFGTALVLNASVPVTLTGRVSVSTSVGALRVTIDNVDFSKTVSMPGSAGLRGATVSAFSLGSSTPQEALVNITVSVPNPSIVRIDPLGDLAARVFYKGVYMGTVYAHDAVLSPGVASLSLSGQLVNSNTAAVNELISFYLSGSPVMMTAVTSSCVGDPQCPHAVPLFAPLLDSGAVALSAVLAGTPTPLVGGVIVQGMFLEPMGATQVRVGLNVTVLVSALLGLNSPLAVTSIALNCTLEGQGNLLGALNVPLTSVYAVAKGGSAGMGEGVGVGGGEVHRGGSTGALAGEEGEVHRGRAVSELTLPPSSSSSLVVTGGAPLSSVGVDVLPFLNVSLSLAAILTLGESDEAFSAFVLDFLQAESVTIGLVSNTSDATGRGKSSFSVGIACVLGNLTVDIPLEARTSVAGINGFPSVEVMAFTVLDADAAPPGTIAADLSVGLFNPSPATFPLGVNATMGIFVSGYRVGEATIFDGILYPGMTVINTRGIIAPPQGGPLEAAATLFSAYLGGVNSTITVVGESVSLGPDQITPGWLLNAVQNLSLAAILPGLPPATARQLMTNATVISLGLDLVDPKAERDALAAHEERVAASGGFHVSYSAPPFLDSPIASGTVRAILQLPFTLPITSFGSVNLSLAFVEVGGGPMATLNLTNQSALWIPCNSTAACDEKYPVSSEQRDAEAEARFSRSLGQGHDVVTTGTDLPTLYTAGVLVLTLDPSDLTITDVPAFARLMGSVLTQKTANVRLLGSASPLGVTLPFGTVPLSGVVIDTEVILRGMANLTLIPPVITPGNIYNTTTDTLYVAVAINVTNPSTLRGHLGPVKFGVAYGTRAPGWDYGTVPAIITSLPALTLEPGLNPFIADGLLTLPSNVTSPNANLLTRSLLSRFLSGLDTDVDMVGLRGGAEGVSSGSPLLQPACAGLVAPANFPGITKQLIRNATLFINASRVGEALFAPSIQSGVLTLISTLDIILRLDQAALTVFMCSQQERVSNTGGPTGPLFNCSGEYVKDIGFFYPGDLSRDFGGVTVPPQSIFNTPVLPLRVDIPLLDPAGLVLLDILSKNNDTILAKVNGGLAAVLDAPTKPGSSPFAVSLNFSQTAVPLFSNLSALGL